MTFGLFFVVALCGGLGAVLRFVTDTIITARYAPSMPWGTISINISGSFALGLLTGLVAGSGLHQTWLLAIGTGLLGGFTTFSSASFDTVRLLKEGRIAASLLNAFGTLCGAVLAAYCGYELALIF